MDVDGNRLIEAYLFRFRYEMFPNIRKNNTSKEIRLLCDDWHISYSRLSTFLHESVTVYANFNI